MPLSSSALSRLEYQHQTIRELIVGLTAQQLRQSIQPGKWTALDNIAHLACYQPVFLLRLERINMESSPVFERYVADSDPAFPDYQRLSPAELLTGIDVQRSTILSKLRGLREDELRRVGQHPRYGLLNVAQWTEFFLLHEAHHLYTIFMLVQELRKELR